MPSPRPAVLLWALENGTASLAPRGHRLNVRGVGTREGDLGVHFSTIPVLKWTPLARVERPDTVIGADCRQPCGKAALCAVDGQVRA
jgi:hypothetical protein